MDPLTNPKKSNWFFTFKNAHVYIYIYMILIHIIWFQKHYPTRPNPQTNPKNPEPATGHSPAFAALSTHSTGGRWREFRVLGSGLQRCRGRGVDGCPSGDEQGEGGGGAGSLESGGCGTVEDVEVEKCHMEIRLNPAEVVFFLFFLLFLVVIIFHTSLNCSCFLMLK